MSDIYLSLTETPSVVTLSQPVVSGVLNSTVTVANTVTVALDANSLAALENITVTVGAAVSVSNFPATQTVAGTVTASLSTLQLISDPNPFVYETGGGAPVVGVGIAVGANGNSESLAVSDVNPFPISGTVTVGNSITIGSIPAISGTVTVGAMPNTTVTVSSFPRPTWTNYSGSVATANSAVTAISTTTRSYLLAQVTTGQMFLNIGATATTLNSVYFSAGQGFAWETSVPQGIVSIISTVTGTNYVLKDG